jgi:hypothetical protein
LPLRGVVDLHLDYGMLRKVSDQSNLLDRLGGGQPNLIPMAAYKVRTPVVEQARAFAPILQDPRDEVRDIDSRDQLGGIPSAGALQQLMSNCAHPAQHFEAQGSVVIEALTARSNPCVQRSLTFLAKSNEIAVISESPCEMRINPRRRRVRAGSTSARGCQTLLRIIFADFPKNSRLQHSERPRDVPNESQSTLQRGRRQEFGSAHANFLLLFVPSRLCLVNAPSNLSVPGVR